ncbi:MAG TPA: polysaccharide deacetylase family protein [Candidatus Binatia bacterium]|jgi:peptidoglycan/xylan/chitin deacetylase (PgdA/CDA1 family)|nr:polysaccharide deacetylase family protein [Candidatus Binatia bacterium]
MPAFGGVPVLLYHGLWTDTAQLAGRSAVEVHYWLRAAEFEAQVCRLAAYGYTTVPLTTFLPDRAVPQPPKPIVLTFDDGWASDWRIAVPILQRWGWRAELFVTVDWIGRPGFMTWEEVREAATAGMGIHSHSLSHPDLDRVSRVRLRAELAASKEVLEQRLGRAVEFFALPGGTGRMSSIIRLARTAGYGGLCTSQVGLNRLGGDPFRLRRIPVTRTTSVATLGAWVQGKGLSALALRRTVSRFARRCLGPTLYERVKEAVL